MSLIRVSNLGKAFRSYHSEWHRIANWFGTSIRPSEEHWVLRHVSFEVNPGEAIGIVGQNGAGKSTLLKMITGTLQPTEGTVHVGGHVSAILELGMGFNPELTGRQNVIHSAGLMGFSSEKIMSALEEIEDFAEIGDYFDAPMRVYSSGMQMRVAFSVATAFRPEILIVDEALSVGDAYYQHKSFARIREFQDVGTSLLFVTHDPGAIKLLCNRAILIDNGMIAKEGDPEEVMDYYNAIIAEKENCTVTVKKIKGDKSLTTSGTGEAQIEEIALYNGKGELSEYFEVGEIAELRIKAKVHQNIETLVLGYTIRDRLGQIIYGTNTWHTGQVIENPATGSEYLFQIKLPVNLGVGSYGITVALHDKETHLTKNYQWTDLLCIFNVTNSNKDFFTGCTWIDTSIKVLEQ